MNNPIRGAFDPIHASDDTVKEVLQMIQKNQSKRPYPFGRALLAAAAAFVLLALTAFAADYVLNQREIFFFDTLEALTAHQAQENPQAAVSCPVPATARENEDLETPAQYVARAMGRGLLDKEETVEEGSAPAAGGEERWVIRECDDPRYGPVVTDYRSSPAYAWDLPVEGLVRWDLTPLEASLTPDEDGQILVLCRSREDQSLLWAKAHLGYTLPGGGRFALSYTYDTTWDYGEQPDYILNDAYDTSEVFVTGDQVQVLLLSYDGQVWAKAANGHRSVDLYATGTTPAQVKELLGRLSLAQVLQ